MNEILFKYPLPAGYKYKFKLGYAAIDTIVSIQKDNWWFKRSIFKFEVSNQPYFRSRDVPMLEDNLKAFFDSKGWSY